MTYWFDEKHGFTVKQTVTPKGRPERVVFEIRQITYAPSPASLFTPPADCTPGGGVTSATGGHAEAQVEATVQQTHDLGSAPPAARGNVTAVRLRLVPENSRERARARCNWWPTSPPTDRGRSGRSSWPELYGRRAQVKGG